MTTVVNHTKLKHVLKHDFFFEALSFIIKASQYWKRWPHVTSCLQTGATLNWALASIKDKIIN